MAWCKQNPPTTSPLKNIRRSCEILKRNHAQIDTNARVLAQRLAGMNAAGIEQIGAAALGFNGVGNFADLVVKRLLAYGFFNQAKDIVVQWLKNLPRQS